jgi:vacuolar-type H+-ATPase subunit E/Vma4
MAFQDILDKILIQAKEKAQSLRDDFQLEKQAIKEEYSKKSDKDLLEIDKNTDLKIAKALKKAKYLAKTEGKNMILAKKSKIINEILKGIIERVSMMPAKDYEQFLAHLMSQIKETEGLCYPAQGKENSTKGAIKLAGKSFKLGPSKDFLGGFYLETDICDLDYSLETLIYNVYRKELEEKIISPLFN